MVDVAYPQEAFPSRHAHLHTKTVARVRSACLSGRRSLRCAATITIFVSTDNVYCLRDEHSAMFSSRRSCHHCEQSTDSENGGRLQRKSWTSRPPHQKYSVSANPQPSSAQQQRCLHLQCAGPAFSPAPAVDHIAPTRNTSNTNTCDRTDNIRGERFHPQVVELAKKSDESHTTQHYLIKNQKYHRHTAALPLYLLLCGRCLSLSFLFLPLRHGLESKCKRAQDYSKESLIVKHTHFRQQRALRMCTMKVVCVCCET